MTISIDRRQVLAGAAALAAAGIVPVRVFAQEASPVAVAGATPTDDGIDVPVLEIAFTVDGVSAMPADIPAGTVRELTSSDGSDSQGSFTFRVPDDQDAEAVLAQLNAPDSPPPDWFFDATFPGGVRNSSREPAVAEGFIVLDPGAYIVADGATGTAASFVATGEAGAAAELPATVHVTAEDTMTYSGLEEPVPAGRQLWRLDNGGELHHNIYIYSRPEGTTAEDILGIFQGVFAGATPEGDEDPFAGFGDRVMDTSLMTSGRSQWFYVDLEPGPYAAMCTAFDSFESPPHFVMGMVVTFEVA